MDELLRVLREIAVLGGPGAVIVGLMVLTPGGRDFLRGIVRTGVAKQGTNGHVTHDQCKEAMEIYRKGAAENSAKIAEEIRIALEATRTDMGDLHEKVNTCAREVSGLRGYIEGKLG